jgi:hypothetical protein
MRLLQADSIFCCESNKEAVSVAREDTSRAQKFVTKRGRNEEKATERTADYKREAKR